jgi:hypothetical protein
MDKKIEEQNKHLKAAMFWLGKIPVQDELVDCMAMARHEIRMALIQNKEDEETEKTEE